MGYLTAIQKDIGHWEGYLAAIQRNIGHWEGDLAAIEEHWSLGGGPGCYRGFLVGLHILYTYVQG